MRRRTFVIEAGRAFPVIAGALYLIRCGSATSPSAVADVQSTSSVANGHTHTVNVSASDQLHAKDTTYTSSSTSGHTHMVTFTATDFANLRAGMNAIEVSTPPTGSQTGHTHTVTVTCVCPLPMGRTQPCSSTAAIFESALANFACPRRSSE